MRILAITWMVLGALMAGGQAHGSIQATFDSDLEGWAGVGGTATQVSPGGNPATGGYLELADSDGWHMYVRPPSSSPFLDDLTGFDGGSFSFDAKLLSIGPPTISQFGTVEIFNGATSLALDFAPTGHPLGTWTTYSMPFTAVTWGVSQGDWTTLLTSVTDLKITLESVVGAETVALDNVTLTPIPEPSTVVIWSVLATLCVGMARWRRRR